MGERTDIAGLIERLEAATGPSEELDEAVWVAATPGATRRMPRILVRLPKYTALIDAAITLIEGRILGAYVGLQKNRRRSRQDNWSGWIETASASGENRLVEATHTTPAIALLIALLRTLETEQ